MHRRLVTATIFTTSIGGLGGLALAAANSVSDHPAAQVVVLRAPGRSRYDPVARTPRSAAQLATAVLDLAGDGSRPSPNGPSDATAGGATTPADALPVTAPVPPVPSHAGSVAAPTPTPAPAPLITTSEDRGAMSGDGSGHGPGPSGQTTTTTTPPTTTSTTTSSGDETRGGGPGPSTSTSTTTTTLSSSGHGG